MRDWGPREYAFDGVIEGGAVCLPAAAAPRAARVLRRGREALPSLIAALCIESRLPIVTTRVGAFRRYRGLRVVPAHLVRASGSGRQILQAAGRLSRDPARSVRW